MERFADSLWNGRDTCPVFFVAAGECRNYMRRVVEEEWVWPELEGFWGGHFHKAVLDVALRDLEDDDYVNFVPIVLDVMHRDTEDRLGPDARGRSFLYALDEIRESTEGQESAITLSAIESAMAYWDEGRLPNGISYAFEGTRRDYLDDKYFYARNGLTGERLEPQRFYEEPDFQE